MPHETQPPGQQPGQPAGQQPAVQLTDAEALLLQLSEDNPAQRLLQELTQQEPGQQGVDVTPFKLPPPPQALSLEEAAGSRLGRSGRAVDPFSKEERAAAAAGVDILTGAPTGRAVAGFAGNEAITAEFFRKELSEFFGQDVRLRKGPESGALEFFNPETRRFTTIDEATVTSRDLADFLSLAPVLLGAGVGELFGGPPGAAAGAAVGEAVSQGIGGILGVSEGLESAVGDIATEAAFAGGGSGVIRGLEAARRGIMRVARPRAVSGEVAESALAAGESSQAIADEISRVSGRRFQPLTGQLAEEETLLGAQAALRSSPETAVVLRQRARENETALEAFFDATTPQGEVQSAVGRQAQQAARVKTQGRLAQGDRIIQSSIDDLEQLIQNLPRAGADTSGGRIRALVTAERRKFKTIEADAYEAAQVRYGLNPETGLSDIKIPISGEVKKTFRALSAEAKESLFAEQAAGKSILTPKSITEATEIDLHQMEEAIRFLRRRKRLDVRGAVAGTPAGRDVDRVLQSMVRQRSEFLAKSRPDVLDAIEQAEFASAERARLFDKSILRSILVKDDAGEFVLRNREVIARTIATGDKDAVSHLMNILSENPAGQQELQKTMLAFYRNEVIADGLPNLALHKRFMERHGEVVKVIFPRQGASIQKFGQTIAKAEDTIARTELFKKAVARQFQGRLQDVAPESVVKKMFTDRFSAKDANRFRNLAQVGGFLPQYERAIGDEIRRRVFTGGVLSPVKLESFLSQHDEVVFGLIGPQYVKDLRTLLSGLKTSVTQPAGIARPAGNSLLDLMRVIVAPPLTRRGRAQTLGMNINRRAFERAMLNAIIDPKGLRAIVAQRNAEVTSKKVFGLLGALGGASFQAGGELPVGPIAPEIVP